MSPFAGFEMPIQYPSGLSQEHLAVREKMGLFDVSHMGQIIISGKDSPRFLDYLLSNVISTLEIGQIRYAVMCNEEGTCIDDLIVYKLNPILFMLVVNAANKDKDFAWIEKQYQQFDGEVWAEDESDANAIIAIQGPKTKAFMQSLMAKEDLPNKYYRFTEDVDLFGRKVLISRTGYTGEHGYEIYAKNQDAIAIWQGLLEAGEAQGLIPCGLGARDTLRLEAGMCLYGHELTESIKPTEANIDFAIKLDREPFIGQQALLEKPAYKRIGLEGLGRGIMREGYTLFANDEKIGIVTSGTMSPLSKKTIGMARVKIDATLENMYVDVRGKKLEVKEADMPFY